jgi:bifunctional non-homologous end joining protein LigD
MGLREYKRKRDFSVTPEPAGEEKAADGRSFCVQKHAATRLHYDFRLEMEGVLKSWAVPKGPCLDPGVKRLAMMTEDHPVEYGAFEGIIPKGEYGGGTVLLWDRGTWEPLEDPHRGLREGKLKFKLSGDKLKGAWMLVRTHGRGPRDDGRSWLLFKERDDEARPLAKYDLAEARAESVASGRSLEEIAADRDRVWHSNRAEDAEEKKTSRRAARPARAVTGARAKPESIPGARRGALPKTVEPQLATLVGEPPEGDAWLHEMKLDGYRIVARIEDGAVRLLSRNNKDWTARFPAVARAFERLRVKTALIDGEAAVVLPDGTTSFQALQNILSEAGTGEGALAYFAFDLLHLDGYDLTRATLEARKAALEPLLPRPDGVLRYSQHVTGSGRAFFDEACQHKLEGILSKQRDAPYQPGRGRSWVKVKCLQEQELVIGGFTDPDGGRPGLGALLLGVHDERGRLVDVGRVGTGFTESMLQDLRRRLRPLERKASPFANKVTGRAMGRVHWVEPRLVAQVAFSEWTSDGKLRHPSFKGLREDKAAQEVVRERPAAATAEPAKPAPKPAPMRARAARSNAVADVPLTHADRVLYPDPGLTKLDLARFYESIADWILPHLQGRPTTLVRCPEGLGKACFYQKHVGGWSHEALRRVKIRERTKVSEYLIVDDLTGLIGLVQMGILEIHTWNARFDDLERPDRVVFDLDPDPSVPWKRVIETAREVRQRLTGYGLASFVKTTGGKGLHVVAPLVPDADWEACAAFSGRVAAEMVRDQPNAFTDNMSKAKRTNKIYIDYLRNRRGATSIAAYSTRARPGAPVSTPLTWDELTPRIRSEQYTVATLPRRLARLKEDPWKAYWTTRQRLPR